MIDTVILSGLTHSQHYCDLHGITDCIIHPRAPLQATLARNQYEWIEDTLSASTADFIVVAGHYPIWSIAEHGSTQDLVTNLMPMLQRHGVNAYLCGQLCLHYSFVFDAMSHSSWTHPYSVDCFQ